MRAGDAGGCAGLEEMPSPAGEGLIPAPLLIQPSPGSAPGGGMLEGEAAAGSQPSLGRGSAGSRGCQHAEPGLGPGWSWRCLRA